VPAVCRVVLALEQLDSGLAPLNSTSLPAPVNRSKPDCHEGNVDGWIPAPLTGSLPSQKTLVPGDMFRDRLRIERKADHARRVGVVSDIGVSNSMLGVTTPGGGSSNLISGNTFLCLAGNKNLELGYDYGAAVPVTDQVVGNSFLTTGGATLNFAIYVGESVTGLTIRSNTISTASNIGIFVSGAAPQGLQLIANSINLGGGNGDIYISGSTTAVSCFISGNQLSSNNLSPGLVFNLASGTLFAKVQGNDFQDNVIGVEVTGTGSVAGIDLGGGSQGSLGGNDFRSFIASSTPSIAAILTQAGSTGTIFAQRNLFSSRAISPGTVCYTVGASIDPSINSTALTGNAAFVETLFIDFLHRAGDTTNPADAGGWVNALNGGGLNQGQVANDILRSAESLGDILDRLYLKILGRQADPVGQTAFVNLLENGGTIEQVTIDMLSSAEYAADTGSDAAFIQSLYYKILGRIPSNVEVQGWLNALPSLGRAGVASGFLFSAEARGDAVEQLYGAPLASPISVASLLPDLLQRTSPPSAGEVAGWVNSGLDLLSLEAALAGSGEFFNNG